MLIAELSIFLINSREAIAAITGDIVIFFTIQRIWIVLVCCLFLRSVHAFESEIVVFSDFETEFFFTYVNLTSVFRVFSLSTFIM